MAGLRCREIDTRPDSLELTSAVTSCYTVSKMSPRASLRHRGVLASRLRVDAEDAPLVSSITY